MTHDNVEDWIRYIDRAGEVHLIAEGPYVRYGMPCHVSVKRAGTHYEVSYLVEGDGAEATALTKERVDRGGLVRTFTVSSSAKDRSAVLEESRRVG